GCGGSRTCPDGRAHPGSASGTSCERSNAGPGGGGFPDCSYISGLVAFAADSALLVIQFLTGAGVEPGHVGPEIAGGAVRKCQRVEAQVELPPAFYLTGTANFGDGA